MPVNKMLRICSFEICTVTKEKHFLVAAITEYHISFFVKNLTGSVLIWFSKTLRIQWYHFSGYDMRYDVRISTQVLKFLQEAKNKVFKPLSFCGLKDSP